MIKDFAPPPQQVQRWAKPPPLDAQEGVKLQGGGALPPVCPGGGGATPTPPPVPDPGAGTTEIKKTATTIKVYAGSRMLGTAAGSTWLQSG